MVILAVDDEFYSRKGILDILQEADGAHTLLEAPNAYEAIRICGEQAVDVVVADIRMPGMDGLEMIERLCAEHPGMDYVIISGYDDFRYAQKALRMGAVDFILKPLHPEELLATVQALDGLRRKKRNSEGVFAEKQLLRALLGEPFEQELLEEHFRQRELCLLLFDVLDSLGRETPANLLPAVSAAFEGMQCLSVSPSPNLYVVVGPARHWEQLRRIAEQLLESVKHPTNAIAADSVIGAGLFADYRKMLLNSEYWLYNHLNTLQIGIFSTPTEPHRAELEEPVRQIQLALRNGSRKAMRAGAADLFAFFKKTRCPSDTVIHTLLSLQVYAKDYLRAQNMGRVESMPSFSALRPPLGELQAEFDQFLVRVSDCFAKRVDQQDSAVHEAIRYINENYTKSISLSALAERVHLNQSYLSRKIKETTHVGFSKYILQLRMEKATELLRQSHSVNQVAEMVGYHDYRQFSQQFREYTGQNPSKYGK